MALVVHNQDDVDPISLEAVSGLAEGERFVVEVAEGVRHAYDADAWLSHLVTSSVHQRERRHVVTRQSLSPTEVWACFHTCLTGMERAAAAGDLKEEEEDERLKVCLSHHIAGTRMLLDERRGRVKLHPVSPLFNMRVKRLAQVKDRPPPSPSPTEPDVPLKRVRVVYDLVDSRDAKRVVCEERSVEIVCPAADGISIT